MELESGGEFLATKNRRCRRGQEFELEFRVGVGEWWGVFSHKEQEKQEVSGVGEKSWSWRVAGSF